MLHISWYEDTLPSHQKSGVCCPEQAPRRSLIAPLSYLFTDCKRMGMYTQDFKLLCVKYLNTGEILPFFFLREYFLFILQVHAATANETPSLFHFQSPLITGALNEPLRCSPTAPPSTPPLVSPSRAGNPTSSSAGLGVSPQPGQSQGQHCTGDWEKLSLIPAQCAASSPLLVSRTRNVPPRHFLLLS